MSRSAALLLERALQLLVRLARAPHQLITLFLLVFLLRDELRTTVGRLLLRRRLALPRHGLPVLEGLQLRHQDRRHLNPPPLLSSPQK